MTKTRATVWAVVLPFLLAACSVPIRQMDAASATPKDPGGAVILISGIPDTDQATLHFDFGDLDVPMLSQGAGVFRGDLTAAQLRGFPHQPKGFRVYRAEVRTQSPKGESHSYPVSVDLNTR